MSERNKYNGKNIKQNKGNSECYRALPFLGLGKRPWTSTSEGHLPSSSHAPSQGLGSLGVKVVMLTWSSCVHMCAHEALLGLLNTWIYKLWASIHNFAPVSIYVSRSPQSLTGRRPVRNWGAQQKMNSAASK